VNAREKAGSPLLRPEDYAQTEAIPPAAVAYRAEALRLGEGVEGIDCRYGEDLYQRIALFVPRKPNGTVLLYLHGGGWISGFKEMMAFMAPGLLEAGVIFASAGYRLAPAHVFPAGFQDTVGALAWMHRNASRYGGKPERIFVGGHSSGGHYAALAAVRRDWQAEAGIPQDAVRGCLAVSGVYDLTLAGGLSQRPRFLGPENNGTEFRASPILNIQQLPPPFLMAWGSHDFPHLMRQGPAMQAALKAAGGRAETMVLEGCTHFTASLATADPALPWRRRALEWMEAN
jgi:acetyl esterase/lipase